MCKFCGFSPVVYRAERIDSESDWKVALCLKCLTQITGEKFMRGRNVTPISLETWKQTVALGYWKGY